MFRPPPLLGLGPQSVLLCPALFHRLFPVVGTVAVQTAQVVGLGDLAREFLEHAHVGEERGQYCVARLRRLSLRLSDFEFIGAVEERDTDAEASVRTGSATVLRTALRPANSRGTRPTALARGLGDTQLLRYEYRMGI